VPFLACGLAAQAPVARDASVRSPAPPPAEVVVASCDPELQPAEFGLGDGGIPKAERSNLHWRRGGCVTPGGVQVECRSVGVKLTFPSGRELLVAPDGHVHLRSGEVAGPFPTGLELWLADGTSVRITLAPGDRDRVRDVVVGDRERRLQPWRRGEPADEVVRNAPWAGLKFVCGGDGGDVYRAIGLGSLLVLERTLVAADRREQTPPERLVVLGTPLVLSLQVMQNQHREPNAAVRKAMAAIGEIADHADALFAPGSQLPRVERNRLRWLLRGDFEIEIDMTGPMAPRLLLFAGRSPLPMVEWTLRADGAAFLTNPREDETGKRWHGNGTRLTRVAPELQARDELFERGYALQVIQRLKR
jgi:hypothetical protein